MLLESAPILTRADGVRSTVVPGRVLVLLVMPALCCLGATGSASSLEQSSPAATTVLHFAAPSALPDRAVDGRCRTPSTAAWFVAEAWACEAGSSTYDPCFRVGAAGTRAWCVSDPRQAGSGTLLNATTLTVIHAASPIHRAWFFELTDGSTCRPLAAPGRIVEGERELYACKYGSAGEADAVLGEIDSTAAVWTIHKVLINKKTEPQTIKSLAIASVRAVWQ